MHIDQHQCSGVFLRVLVAAVGLCQLSGELITGAKEAAGLDAQAIGGDPRGDRALLAADGADEQRRASARQLNVSLDLGAAQVGATQVGATQVDATQVGATQVGTTQVGAAQVGAAQVGATQVGAT